MDMASPTPMGSSHFSQLNRRPSARHVIRKPPSRQQLNRTNTLPPSAPGLQTTHSRQYSMNDSSDDEIIPMKFSAITNALLNDESLLPPSSPATRKASHASPAYSNSSRHIRGASAGLVEARGREATASPETRANSPFPKRVIRFSGTPGSSTLRKRTSLSGAVRKYNEQAAARSESPSDVSTPAHGHGSVRIPITSSVGHGRSTGSSGRLSHRSGSVMYSKEADGSNPEEPATISRAQAAINYGSVSRYGLSTIGRARYGEDTGVMASSMRTKCVVKEDAKFMRGPARRGRRRQSDEDQEPEQENEGAQDAGFSSQEPQSQDLEPQPVSQETAPSSFYDSQHRDLAPSSPMRASQASKYNMQSSPSPVAYATLSQLAPEPARHASPPRPQPEQPVFRIPAPRPDRPELPSAHDQENEAPPTFKRNKPVPFTLLDKIDKVATRSQSQDLGVSRAALSPPRNVLAPRSHNTPHRPAPPPPPRMSVLETATATAGAATTAHASKKRNNIRVNGKAFTRLDIIGRGGSSKVWRVMAENGKFFALKRVNLEDADESAVRGYKGEIDLLSKLKGNDRVVSMLDYEMNDDKQTLSVLMEMGELDFNKILTLRFNTESARFDPSFTRHYWKEMLECIEAVHQHDIVHSDLKPANFVLVQGRLKLIDFGIANAIQTDETVNVHRETQVGTPNYMSPESLIDANELSHLKGTASNQPKVVKLGKPSDIWSLGCILYQMSYGRQPFAHIQNQMSRFRAIIDFSYAIEFPSAGVGGVQLPKSLIRTMKKCLTRDQFERPTVAQLLSERDAFLYPGDCDSHEIAISEELLGRILQNFAQKCKDHSPTDAEMLVSWPAGYFASLKRSA